MTTYNGWTNHATWKVGLECFDGWDIACTFSSDEWLKIMGTELADLNSGHTSDIADSTKAELFKQYMITYMADYMRCLPEEWVSEVKDLTLQGWLASWLDQVNWRELAEHHLEMDALYCQMVECVKNGGAL